MKMQLFLAVGLITLGAVVVEGYNILCVFGVPSKSHNHLGGGIVKALLKAGHDVTWVTPYPPKNPQKGLTVIDAGINVEMISGIDMSDKRYAEQGLSFVLEFSRNVSIATANLPKLKEVMVRGNYDAVVTEAFFNEVDAGYAAALQVPWILLSGIVLQPHVEAQVDDPKSVPMVPLLFNDFPIPMNFWHRLINVGMYAFMQAQSWWKSAETSALYTSLFGQLAAQRGHALPPLNEAMNNVSILFVNSHSSFAPAQSLPPNVIDIGGYHIEDSIVPLPKDFQELLDSSSQGVVYFSMGSVIKSSNLPLKTRKELLDMFSKLPYTVVWKFEETIEGLPKNVHIRQWMPQAAILAHKNTKAFVTHGGLLSTLETLRYGVPVVTIPVFGDQPANAARAVRAGYALRVTYDFTTMVGDLEVALKEIMGNDKYYKRVKYLSFLFNNRPVAPSKLIPHYVQLAIETKGAHHLRSKSKEYAWYQKWMLDLLAFVLTILYILFAVVKKVISILFGKKNESKGGKMKKN